MEVEETVIIENRKWASFIPLLIHVFTQLVPIEYQLSTNHVLGPMEMRKDDQWKRQISIK